MRRDRPRSRLPSSSESSSRRRHGSEWRLPRASRRRGLRWLARARRRSVTQLPRGRLHAGSRSVLIQRKRLEPLGAARAARDAIDSERVVAFSAVQSADGSVADLDGIVRGAQPTRERRRRTRGRRDWREPSGPSARSSTGARRSRATPARARAPRAVVAAGARTLRARAPVLRTRPRQGASARDSSPAPFSWVGEHERASPAAAASRIHGRTSTPPNRRPAGMPWRRRTAAASRAASSPRPAPPAAAAGTQAGTRPRSGPRSPDDTDAEGDRVPVVQPQWPCDRDSSPRLDPLDFLAIDALLDDEERAIRDTVRQFVRERVLPEVGDWFEQGILPRELIAELGEARPLRHAPRRLRPARARAPSPTA